MKKLCCCYRGRRSGVRRNQGSAAEKMDPLVEAGKPQWVHGKK